MTLLEALRSRLLAVPDVTALVGNRIYSLKLPQSGAYPAIRLQEVDRLSYMHERGTSVLYRSRVQVDACESEGNSNPYGMAHEVSLAARGKMVNGAPSALAGFRGRLNGIEIKGILADVQRERYESQVQLVRVEADYIVWFRFILEGTGL